MPEEQKTYFLGIGKPKLTVEKLAESFAQAQKVNTETMQMFSQLADNRFNQLSQEVKQLFSMLQAIREQSDIPKEWIEKINEMREFDSNLPESRIIYSVLMAYKNLPQNKAKVSQEKVIEKLTMTKNEIVSRKIHNCKRCGKAIEEGEFYLFAGKPYCLEHRDEPLNQQGKEEAL